MIESLPLLAWPLRQTLSILIFHRVLPAADPLRIDEPTADEFDSLMAYLARNYRVLPLREAVALLRRGQLPRLACCITFDDGYADNLTIALPILEKYGLPATVFIATGYLDGGRMFNDAVIDGIARSPLKLLDLKSIGLGVLGISTDDNRRHAVGHILANLKYHPPQQRTEDIEAFLQIAQCGNLSGNIMLTSGQVGELAKRGVEIGGHTVNHPILACIDNDAARAEILIGKQRLESIIGKPVHAFAYPNGRPNQDYLGCHAHMVRELGFELAVTTSAGVSRPENDLFQLPRFTPWDKSKFMFSARMTKNALIGKAETTC